MNKKIVYKGVIGILFTALAISIFYIVLQKIGYKIEIGSSDIFKNGLVIKTTREKKLTSKEIDELIETLKKKTEKGNLAAIKTLGKFYANGVLVKQDLNQAFHLYTLAANQNDAEAEAELGKFYMAGEVVNQDFAKALQLFEKAAHQQEPNAQLILGNLYEHGTGVPQNYSKAAEYYELVMPRAEQDKLPFLPILQFNLANFYRQGLGVPKNIKRAIELYTASANTKSHVQASALTALGHIYSFSFENIKPDRAKALEFYHMAAEKGNASAQVNLGIAYLEGREVPKDVVKALELFELAAEKNEPYALYNLGILYMGDFGIIKQDKLKAIQLFTKASKFGNEPAKQVLEMLKKEDCDISDHVIIK